MIEAFLLFAVLVLADTFAAQRWLPLYYRFGIPVFFARRSSDRGTRGALDAQAAQRLADRMSARFRARSMHPTIDFRALPGGLLAFRERLFENRGGLKYLPVMHSTARRGEDEQVTVTGYLNLYALFTIIYLAYRVFTDPTYTAVAVLVLIVLAVSYVTQAAINRSVAEAVANAAADREEPSPAPVRRI